jgi:excisionase family DNA binding protein
MSGTDDRHESRLRLFDVEPANDRDSQRRTQASASHDETDPNKSQSETLARVAEASATAADASTSLDQAIAAARQHGHSWRAIANAAGIPSKHSTDEAATASHKQTREVDMSTIGRQALTVTEAAEILGISRALAYELVSRGDIPALRLGRRLVVPRKAIDAMLNDHADESWPASLRTDRTTTRGATPIRALLVQKPADEISG